MNVAVMLLRIPVNFRQSLTRCLWNINTCTCSSQQNGKENLRTLSVLSEKYSIPALCSGSSDMHVNRRVWTIQDLNELVVNGLSYRTVRRFSSTSRLNKKQLASHKQSGVNITEIINSARKKCLHNCLAAAMREGNNVNPARNKYLALAILEVKSWDTPDATLNLGMKAAEKVPGSVLTYDVYGDAGLCFVVQFLSQHETKIRNNLEQHVKKTGMQVTIHKDKDTKVLNPRGDTVFEQKGIIEVPLQTTEENENMDKYIEVALEAGAEDVTMESKYGKPILQFTCAPLDFNKTVINLEEAGYIPCGGSVKFVPVVTVPLQEHQLTTIARFLYRVFTFENFVNIYHNVSRETELPSIPNFT